MQQTTDTMKTLPMIRSAQRRLARRVPAPVYRAIRGTWRIVRLWLPQGAFERRFEGLPGPVHAEDHMLRDTTPGAVAHYRSVGLEAYERIGEALAAVDRRWRDVESLLDFGCGHGRVLRWVHQRQPHVALTAADVNRHAVEFCRRAFDAQPLRVSSDPERIRLDHRWDVMWLGSVLTHVDESDGFALLKRLAASLAPRGVLVFTTHGELIPARVPEYGQRVSRAAGQIRSALDSEQTCFVPGDAFEGATTFHARSRVRQALRTARLRLVLFRERGWDDHQDIWGVTGET